MRTLVLCRVRPTTCVPAYVPCVGDGSPALRSTGVRRGEARTSQDTGPSSSCVLWSNTPPDTAPPPCPKTYAEGHCCLRRSPALSASGKTIGFGAAVPRPARSRAYASPHLFPRTTQGSLPARVGSPLAGRDSHPLDDARSFMVASHPPIPFDPQGLVALEFLVPPCSAYWIDASRAVSLPPQRSRRSATKYRTYKATFHASTASQCTPPVGTPHPGRG
jgi:hypothetical protein